MNQWLVPGVYFLDGLITGFQTFYFADGSLTEVSNILGQNSLIHRWFNDQFRFPLLYSYLSSLHISGCTGFRFPTLRTLFHVRCNGPISRAFHNVTFRMVRWVHVAGSQWGDWRGQERQNYRGVNLQFDHPLLHFPINLSQFLQNKVDVMLKTLHSKQCLHSAGNSGNFYWVKKSQVFLWCVGRHFFLRPRPLVIFSTKFIKV